MKKKKQTERIDKFLWSVRLFKTRSKATEACKAKKIFINEQAVKPSYNISEGDTFSIKIPPKYREYKVKGILSKRVGAKLVPDYLEEITPEDVLEEFKLYSEHMKMQRNKGTGRPTKKERRDLNRFFG